ncbi:exodeoxyribonuclease V subunit alpha [Pseudoxanthomonas sangjuensis]|uniref:exodeoxyribonuclease V subunit alpha n=1 Tax=Pseudoxanthomonas sangjuensis TaxID=1503750 RepID=UPI00139121D9|nr:exodeoxyribonuclease V subunit alpha [Pseudoxanthomonas sangjuensis]KAF1714543.1 exodeoxyribonuclease V subunit alpha [Pseudoxanthomonas sangjuensis]
MSLFDDLARAGALRTLDHAFAQSLRRLDGATPDEVLAAAALASLAVSQGHAAFDPSRPQLHVEGAFAWPATADWLRALAGSRWVAQPAAPAGVSPADAPLVLENGLLYLRRYREYERRLASGLQRIAASPESNAGVEPLGDLFAVLFPEAKAGEDLQARAAAMALRHKLLLVTGGPGTGKTTPIARLLVLLAARAVQQQQPLPDIALAAPTGRAAERMAESLRSALRKLQGKVDATLLDALPTGARTLHRLLGTIPESVDFRHGADNPLRHDVVVVDEASMVDLPLMAKLVEAVADGARLILLGDPDQLPSVEAGDVLAAILHAAGDGASLDAEDARLLQPLLSASPAADDAPRAFAARRVHLRRGYRQQESLRLAPLAEAVRDGDADAALQLLRGGLGGVHFHENLADPLEAHRDILLARWRELAATDDPVAALALSARLRLLAAVREGAQGVHALNVRIGELLSGVRRRAATEHFHGQLLLVTENDYRNRLFNGDVGVCLRGADGALLAWFPGETEGNPRAFHPAALPAHDSAFATTVHKAQGSEFDSVWLQLPRNDNRVLSRELVYTAITRARGELHIAASEAVLRAALGRHVVRVSGLSPRLSEIASR